MRFVLETLGKWTPTQQFCRREMDMSVSLPIPRKKLSVSPKFPCKNYWKMGSNKLLKKYRFFLTLIDVLKAQIHVNRCQAYLFQSTSIDRGGGVGRSGFSQ